MPFSSKQQGLLMKLTTLILAAGQGTRMHSNKPKILHTLAGKPLLQHVIETAQKISHEVVVIYGHAGEQVKQALSFCNVTWVEQKEQLGTGHAVKQALPLLPENHRTLILYGDTPLISLTTLENLLNHVPENSIGWLTANFDNPTGLGRIVRDENHNPIAIIEEKDATDLQKETKEINTGICLIPNRYLQQFLPKVQNQNAQKEFYLTDLFGLAVQQGIHIVTVQAKDNLEIRGVNNKFELAQLERAYQARVAEQFTRAGLTLLDPARFDLRGNLKFGRDCVIDVNVVLEGNIELGDNCYIGPNCILKNVHLEKDCHVEANSILEDAQIAEACTIGPFARIRPGTVLKAHAKIGNFVEVKKSVIGKNSKVSHLSYVGDALLGEHVNVGAGTITCNYDGVNKHQTIIEDEAFIGSNTSLVAPVKIGKAATIGAGSTITKNALDGELTLARGKQVTIEGWQRPKKKD